VAGFSSSRPAGAAADRIRSVINPKMAKAFCLDISPTVLSIAGEAIG